MRVLKSLWIGLLICAVLSSTSFAGVTPQNGHTLSDAQIKASVERRRSACSAWTTSSGSIARCVRPSSRRNAGDWTTCGGQILSAAAFVVRSYSGLATRRFEL